MIDQNGTSPLPDGAAASTCSSSAGWPGRAAVDMKSCAALQGENQRWQVRRSQGAGVLPFAGFRIAIATGCDGEGAEKAGTMVGLDFVQPNGYANASVKRTILSLGMARRHGGRFVFGVDMEVLLSSGKTVSTRSRLRNPSPPTWGQGSENDTERPWRKGVQGSLPVNRLRRSTSYCLPSLSRWRAGIVLHAQMLMEDMEQLPASFDTSKLCRVEHGGKHTRETAHCKMRISKVHYGDFPIRASGLWSPHTHIHAHAVHPFSRGSEHRRVAS